VEQGISREEWGPPWPKGSKPMTTLLGYDGKSPFYRTTAIVHWGREENEPQPEPQLEKEQRPVFGISGALAKLPEQPKPSRRVIGYEQTPLGPLPIYYIPNPTVMRS
jgi:hypothetical protein